MTQQRTRQAVCLHILIPQAAFLGRQPFILLMLDHESITSGRNRKHCVGGTVLEAHCMVGLEKLEGGENPVDRRNWFC